MRNLWNTQRKVNEVLILVQLFTYLLAYSVVQHLWKKTNRNINILEWKWTLESKTYALQLMNAVHERYLFRYSINFNVNIKNDFLI
jgi:hypothetical protein